ncbi:MAG TPA: hypothetical protein VGQ83_19245 [Polyangia bacterium]
MARIEFKATAAEKERFVRAAKTRGISLSDWVRWRLAEAAEAELSRTDPRPPSAEDIAEAEKAHGALEGCGLRERIERLRQLPSTVPR